MAARRSMRSGRTVRRPTSWERLQSTAPVTIPAASKVLLATYTVTGDFGVTVRRNRGRLWVQSDQAAAVEQQLGAVGFVVVTELALTAGIGSLPSPVAQGDDDGWFVLEHISQAGSKAAGGPAGYWYPFDSKGMRKIEPGYAIAVVAENASVLFGMEVAIGVSTLFSLK